MQGRHDSSGTLISATLVQNEAANIALCECGCRLRRLHRHAEAGRSKDIHFPAKTSLSRMDWCPRDAVKARARSRWQKTQSAIPHVKRIFFSFHISFFLFFLLKLNPQLLIVWTEVLTKPRQRPGALVLTEGEPVEHRTCPTCTSYICLSYNRAAEMKKKTHLAKVNLAAV